MTTLAPATSRPLRELFRADWREALFIHFLVDPAKLQRSVPLELDLYDGRAYVSLVAFTQANLRPSFGGALTAWLSGPLATHGFLNLRTYVRTQEERGIYFLSEWIPNALAAFLGPKLYGLPYHLGQLKYATGEIGEMTRDVVCPAGRFCCRATVDSDATYSPSPPRSETAFLLERYTAFTHRRGILRRFRIRHEPWRQVEVKVTIEECGLLDGIIDSPPQSAHFSPGLNDVAIGRPERVGTDS
jgi:uncharacterized protein YqjF (DUF2071 family)